MIRGGPKSYRRQQGKKAKTGTRRRKAMKVAGTLAGIGFEAVAGTVGLKAAGGLGAELVSRDARRVVDGEFRRRSDAARKRKRDSRGRFA